MAEAAVDYEEAIPEIVWLKPFAEHFFLEHKRWFFCHGGRNGGRSYAISRKIVQIASQRKTRTICVRWNRSSTKDSMRVEIRNAIFEMKLEGYWDLTKDGEITCINGSVILFSGLEHQNGLRSLTDIDIVWIEEDQYIKDPDFTEFRHTVIRKPGVMFFFSGNPQYEDDPVYEWCMDQTADHVSHVYSCYKDNPYLSDDAKREILDCKKNDPETYEHDWLGIPRKKGSVFSVISQEWIESSIDLFKNYESQLHTFTHDRQYANDPADGGGDNNVFTARSGPFVEHIEIMDQPKGRIGDACQKMHDVMTQFGGNRFYYDIGAVPGRDVANWYSGRNTPYRVIPIAFGAKTLGEDVLYNRLPNQQVFRYRSVQMYWNLRRRFRNSWLLSKGDPIDYRQCIFIDPECCNGDNGTPTKRQLIKDLTQAIWKRAEGDRIVVTKDPDEVYSPGIFDSLALDYHKDIERGLRG